MQLPWFSLRSLKLQPKGTNKAFDRLATFLLVAFKYFPHVWFCSNVFIQFLLLRTIVWLLGHLHQQNSCSGSGKKQPMRNNILYDVALAYRIKKDGGYWEGRRTKIYALSLRHSLGRSLLLRHEICPLSTWLKPNLRVIISHRHRTSFFTN